MKPLRSLPLLLLLAFPALLSAQTPVGSAIQVATMSGVGGTDVAMSPRGGFVVAWARTRSSDGFPLGVFGRIYNADGSPRTGEFRINENRSDRAFAVRLAMMDDGSFVAVFATSGFLEARRFAADGRPLGGNFRVAHSLFGGFEVGSRGDGSFAVAWAAPLIELAARAFGADDRPLGPEVQIVAASAGMPRLAVRPDGSFLVVWAQVETTGPAAHDFFIRGRLFDAGGTPWGETFLVSQRLSEDDFSFAGYATAVDDEGNFLVTWLLKGGDPVLSSTFLRRYGPDGSPLTGPLPAGHRPAGDEIATGPEGTFVSVWQTDLNRPSVSVIARQLAVDGAPLGPLVVLRQAPSSFRPFPNPLLAGNGAGSFVVTWFGKPRRGEGSALFVQRLRTE